jgi:phospholipid/cholesterol/gamma-HCH transport system substrate-binding protein
MTADEHHGERGLLDQIERYRTAFISIVVMIVLAVFVGGYILSHERISLPSWVPVVGNSYVTLKGEFQTGQALTPGQGQSVTIAGAKIGEIASVDLHEGDALVTMNITPKYAKYIYRDATMLLRPKTQLKDMTVEVDPGTPSAGRVPSGYVVPLSQTAPDVNFEEFLSALDAETREYLQELVDGAGIGLKGNSENLSAAFRRFDPISRLTEKITKELHLRHRNIERGIHNFQLILSALGGKDTELAQLIESSNAVFKVFAEQNQNVQRTLQLLPGALAKTNTGFAKLAKSASVAGTTLRELEPFAKALGPAQEAGRKSFLETTPIIKNQVRPYTREVVPVISELGPSIKELGEAFPKLESGLSVFNEFFNELAYNPGPKQGGFMFFLDWANHDLNSALSTADAHGPIGRTLLYLNCEILPILKGAGEVNPTVRLLIALFNPPTGAECQALGLGSSATTTGASTAKTAAAHGSAHPVSSKGFSMGLLGSKHSAFGRLATAAEGDR